ncbi:MAG: hypothetical protein ACJ71G_11660 [Nitrososphaeraceae archaeon]
MGPRPPVLVVFLTAFWCVATTLRATIRGRIRTDQAVGDEDGGGDGDGN